MYKKILSFILILCLIIVSGYILFNDLQPEKIENEIKNCSKNIFNSEPKGAFPNCGPEYRINLNRTINSKEEFLEVLKEKEGSVWWLGFDNFKANPGDLNWTKISNSIEVCISKDTLIYSFEYVPDGCLGYSINANSKGLFSVYGCCGK